MGLFDFAKNMGKKVFKKDDKNEVAAQKIKDNIEVANPGVKDLDVEFEGGKVKITGEAESADAFEKTVLMAGNVDGVEEVDGSEVKKPEQDKDVEYYIIKSGDTLSKIAEDFLGDASKYNEIFEANKEVIEDPNKIFPGQKIRIPKV